MANVDTPARAELVIPCRPEFVGVARLAILGVASRMRFSYDEVEDVRLAVGEACTIAVEWAERNARTDSTITLRSEIEDDKLTVDIYDEAGVRTEEIRGNDEQEVENIGVLLITLLVDKFEVEPQAEGTHVRIVKYAGKR